MLAIGVLGRTGGAGGPPTHPVEALPLLTPGAGAVWQLVATVPGKSYELVVDTTGLDVRFEPGMPYDPPEMRFPHAYGTVPTSAVIAEVPYPPRSDGTFPPPPEH